MEGRVTTSPKTLEGRAPVSPNGCAWVRGYVGMRVERNDELDESSSGGNKHDTTNPPVLKRRHMEGRAPVSPKLKGRQKKQRIRKNHSAVNHSVKKEKSFCRQLFCRKKSFCKT